MAIRASTGKAPSRITPRSEAPASAAKRGNISKQGGEDFVTRLGAEEPVDRAVGSGGHRDPSRLDAEAPGEIAP